MTNQCLSEETMARLDHLAHQHYGTIDDEVTAAIERWLADCDTPEAHDALANAATLHARAMVERYIADNPQGDQSDYMRRHFVNSVRMSAYRDYMRRAITPAGRIV